MMGSLEFCVVSLEKIGWFIPPYVNMGQIEQVLAELDDYGHIKQDKLGYLLASIYPVETISDVFIEKYAKTPFVKDYINIIDNGIECHFLGLNYSSVSTLVPVIEGVARKLASHRGVEDKYVKKTIQNLCKSCKEQVVDNQLGDYNEVESMIDSFEKFVTEKFYSNSQKYPHEDNTNRNGITHGTYGDIEFGNQVSFYKIISLINFLSFLSAIDAGLSWFPPKGTREGNLKANYLVICQKLSVLRESYR